MASSAAISDPNTSITNQPNAMTTTSNSPTDALATKTAEAAHAYALKNYVEAADLYSQATAMQAELHGEMAPENAELLYAYGRALYKVAVEKNDVLGGKVAGPTGATGSGSGGGGGGGVEKKQQQQQTGKKRKKGDEEREESGVASETVGGKTVAASPEKKDNAPYFQIEGDDPDWDSDESGAEGGEVDEADAVAAEEEEEDDLATAYEILDTARVLLLKRVETLDEAATEVTEQHDGDETTTTSTNGKATSPAQHQDKAKSTTHPTKRHIQDLLADTYDLQSEISLENERFSDAATDAKASLALKTALYPFDSSLVAEAHYKVSLALEFAGKTTAEMPDELTGELRKQVAGVDEDILRESARHMELAIESTRGRIVREGREAEACVDRKEKDRRRKEVKEVKEILVDMEEHLKELRAPPAALSTAALEGPGGALAALAGGAEASLGLLGALLGESPAAAKEKIAEATRTANDLTGMVRHRKKGADVGKQLEVNGSGASGVAAKRKSPALELDGAVDEQDRNGSGKKARVEDAEEVDELA